MFNKLREKFQKPVDPAKTVLGRLEIVRQDLANIADVEAMVRGTGWRRVRRELEGVVVKLSKEKYGLEINPTMNHDEIVAMKAEQSAIMRLLFVVDETIGRKVELLNLESEYLELIETADIQRRSFVGNNSVFSQEKV